MGAGKTNAMRILDVSGITYRVHEYDHRDGQIDGIAVAEKLHQPTAQVFKTLVTQGNSKNYYVFVLPVSCELDLKAAARSVEEKSVEMIHAADLQKVTGYIRGGCSPVGMKKSYPTVLDESAFNFSTIMVSAGRIGQQIELSPQDLQAVTGCKSEAIAATGRKG